MKKIIAIVLLGLSLSLMGCGGDNYTVVENNELTLTVEEKIEDNPKNDISGKYEKINLTIDQIKDGYDQHELYLGQLGLKGFDGICDIIGDDKKFLEQIWSLVLSNNEIEFAGGDLSCFTNLQLLDLSYNKISSFKQLLIVNNLKKLFVQKNKLVNVSGIDKMENLTHLNVGYNELTNIDGIENLKNLESLRIQHNSIEDISLLKGLTNLKALSAEFNKISNFDVISELSLEELSAKFNNIDNEKIIDIMNSVNSK